MIFNKHFTLKAAKRLCAAALSLCLTMGLFSLSSLYANAESSKDLLGNSVSWNYDENQKCLTFHGNGKMPYPDSSESFEWHRYADRTVSVKIEKGITSIGAHSFRDFRHITDVDIADTVNRVEWAAFKGCSALTEITLPSSVRSIETEAFADCVKLKNISLPSDLAEIDANVFENTAYYNQKSNWDSKGVLYIGNALIKAETNLSGHYAVKGNTKVIAAAAFLGCHNLTGITLPTGIKKIDKATFQYCTELRTVDIPQGVTTIGGVAFCACTALKVVKIPNSVKEIYDWAFRYCPMESLKLPDSVTYINDSAFSNCNSLVLTVGANSYARSYAEEYNIPYKVDCNHKYGAYSSDDETHSRTCSICQTTDTDDHKWQGGDMIKKADCKNAGVVRYTCTVCGKILEGFIDKSDDHSFGGWKTSKKPTCTENGEEIRTCTVCGKSEIHYTAALGHSFKKADITKAPTCTEKGTESGICTRCGKAATNAVNAKGHSFGGWSVQKAETCTEPGAESRKCSVCGKIEVRVKKAAGHDFESPKTVKAPTISEYGITEGKCRRCGETTRQTVPCKAVDEKTGIIFETDEGVFKQGTELKVTEITEKSSAYKAVKASLSNISKSFTAFDISAVLNGSEVQPNGSFTAKFKIPKGYGSNVAVYGISKDGQTATFIKSQISEDGNYVTADFSGTSRYAVCKTDKSGAVGSTADSGYSSAFFRAGIAALAAILIIAAITVAAALITKKHRKKED